MFVAHSARTMASIKITEPEDDGIVRKTIYRRVEQQERAAIERGHLALERGRLAAEQVARKQRELDRAKAMLSEHKPGAAKYTYARIEAMAMVLFGVSRQEITCKRRGRDLTFVRQFIAYWCCRKTALSLPQIGRLMGGRDHTTIIHGKRAYVAKRKAAGRTLREVR